ncbi:uncharacterized protein LY89DRAFT_503574 [Mollisia scopiformis]|uniref:Uncharacterized protein n=1 Tax=Mollisia scopiformis TaxID=149040 RepID=A0A194XF17_MOLSC|nr:uncharacterized protein LY89DRAFT_503574 [Mollisia scopiformis]KUJ18729.1 hypothetical protein LY89DRAFT_503574 [Mollisia scopiformis]
MDNLQPPDLQISIIPRHPDVQYPHYRKQKKKNFSSLLFSCCITHHITSHTSSPSDIATPPPAQPSPLLAVDRRALLPGTRVGLPTNLHLSICKSVSTERWTVSGTSWPWAGNRILFFFFLVFAPLIFFGLFCGLDPHI